MVLLPRMRKLECPSHCIFTVNFLPCSSSGSVYAKRPAWPQQAASRAFFPRGGTRRTARPSAPGGVRQRAPRAAGLRPGPGRGGRGLGASSPPGRTRARRIWYRSVSSGDPLRPDAQARRRRIHLPEDARLRGVRKRHKRIRPLDPCDKVRVRHRPCAPVEAEVAAGIGRRQHEGGARPSPPPAGGRGARAPPSRGVVELHADAVQPDVLVLHVHVVFQLNPPLRLAHGVHHARGQGFHVQRPKGVE